MYLTDGDSHTRAHICTHHHHTGPAYTRDLLELERCLAREERPVGQAGDFITVGRAHRGVRAEYCQVKHGQT